MPAPQEVTDPEVLKAFSIGGAPAGANFASPGVVTHNGRRQ